MKEQEFICKLEKIGIDNKEISILVDGSYFECNLKKEMNLNKIMFLGLNRSNPRESDLPYHNMREPIRFILDNFKGKIEGAYLTDFVKYKLIRGKLSGLSEGKKVENFLKKDKDMCNECGEILKKEISEFNIETIFCFGWNVWKLLQIYFTVKPEETEYKIETFSELINNREVRFFKIKHYGRNAKKEEIIKQIEICLKIIGKLSKEK